MEADTWIFLPCGGKGWLSALILAEAYSFAILTLLLVKGEAQPGVGGLWTANQDTWP